MTMPPEGYELFRRVQQAAEGTPYLVTETEKGFDVTLDVVDAQWFGLFNKAGLQKVYIHHVSFPRSGTYTITDDSRSVEWVAGVPELKASAERQYGRVIEFGAQKVWAFDERGHFGVRADYRFNSEEGRDLVTGVAEQLGLAQRRGAAEKTGITMAAITLIGLAIGGVVALVLWLTTDYFG
ncbi:hypothetical protein GON03_09285 [Nocardioides sp. MAH-18]|uniref:Uncharacterized protein n=1 Tax=Nocardioides agri TaxID=2682843 RepID=A0A6L6XQ13_9ACTN|nr:MULTISPECIES: hypothetical protein [unclassified Nocardioides]MBA2954513.1 hypothetical protein [Nocardioides sp. CGMCC 1.13656]MVQ49374.1 hypothetical protein [Nocardioides sp. MAH-18]